MKRDRDNTVILVAEFLEKFRDACLNKTVSVTEFSPIFWFKEKGGKGKELASDVLKYLSDNNIITIGGIRKGQNFRWNADESVKFESLYLAECYFDHYSKTEREAKVPHIPVTPKLKSNNIEAGQRFNIFDYAYVLTDNLIIKVKIVGISCEEPYDKSSKVNYFCWNPSFTYSPDDKGIRQFSNSRLFHNVESLTKHLTAQIQEKF